MKKNKNSLFLGMAAFLFLAVPSCTDKIDDPGKREKEPAEQQPSGRQEEPAEEESVVDDGVFTTYTWEGFSFKIRSAEVGYSSAKKAMDLLKKNLTEINALLPDFALEVMHKNPIWMEKNLTDGAAWYHTSIEWLAAEGYMTEKWHCVELCNYVHYVSWTNQNQPYMILHELCHLFHDQYLPGGFDNPDVLAAYSHAMNEGLYVNTAYRLDDHTLIEHYDDYYHAKVYATTNCMEYFSEICEAYWGENDYYPFNYDDLKAYDVQGFALMEKVWGPREDK